jgi:predicted dehydrogenase
MSCAKGNELTPIRWGILGPGAIAEKFATGLSVLPDARLAAIASRDGARAHVFADRFGAERAWGSYEDLANDPDVDVIYVSTPHPVHFPAAKHCLEAGKAVLCEKPFTVNADEAAELIRIATSRNLFLMEAMWTRFLPLFVELRSLLAEGAIGEPRLLTADFGFAHPGPAEHRLFNPLLAGGSLLDVGIYICSLASMVFGRPHRIQSAATLGATGVDELAAMTFEYANGAMAQLNSAVRLNTPNEAMIAGTEGIIRIPAFWWKGERLIVQRPGQSDLVVDAPMDGNGYNYEAAEVMRCLRAGEIQSSIMPHAETLAQMETLDAIRAQWGLAYPTEA